MLISIVICTYNPRMDLLSRALKACTQQSFASSEFELLLVDNNSTVPLREDPFLIELQKTNSNLVLLHEKKQGLAHARICGVKACKASTVVFMDDDNEPETNYLRNLKQLLDTHPDVAVWGPGTIALEYVDGAPHWIKKNFGYMFQEKNLSETKFSCEAAWPAHYPAGSGLVVSKEVLDSYIQQFEAGLLSSTGRKGESLTSGEDSQIVWTAVKQKKFVGTSPLLKLNHLIPGNRCTLAYLKKLNQAISYSYYSSLCEMFPEKRQSLKPFTQLSRIKLFVTLLLKSTFTPGAFYYRYRIENAWIEGYTAFLKHTTK